MKQKNKAPRAGGAKHISSYLKNLKELYAPAPNEATDLPPSSRDSSISVIEAPKEAAR